jgi:hypothetical protein
MAHHTRSGGDAGDGDPVDSRAIPIAESHSVYVAAINEAAEQERSRKKSLEERGSRVITTSGALGTLLLGIVKFTAGTSPSVDQQEAASLAAALFFFGLAALLALLANAPRASLAIDDKILDGWVSLKSWPDYDAEKATYEIAKMKVDLVVEARVDNREIGLLVFLGSISQVFALVCVALAVAFIVEVHPAVWASAVTFGIAGLITFLVVRKFGWELVAIRRKPLSHDDK